MTNSATDLTTYRQASRYVPPEVVTPPAEEPITVLQARRQCKCEDDAEDELFAIWIKAAREAVEFDAELALITQTRRQYIDYFPDGPIELRTPPVQSISSITYTDTSGSTQTLASTVYDSDLISKPALIMTAEGQTWPATRTKLRSVAINFICGFGLATSVPALAKQAMLLRISSSYRNREMTKEETLSYDNLIAKLRWRGPL